MKFLGIFILAVIAIFIGSYVFYKYLLPMQPPLPETEKARFIRYLTCSYAMCAKGCNDNEVINIGLEKVGETTMIGCYDNCSKMANEQGVPLSTKMCDRKYALEFVFKDDVTYYGNYWDGVIPPDAFTISGSMQSDLKNLARKWHEIQSDERCFGTVSGVEKVNIVATSDKTDGLRQVTPWVSGVPKHDISLDPGCAYIKISLYGDKVRGMCEGMLRSSQECKRNNTLGDTSGYSQLLLGTGHLWIDANIVSQCQDFGAGETTRMFGSPTGSRYYASCNFNNGQKIQIWSEADKKDADWFLGWKVSEEVYCPELIICSV